MKVCSNFAANFFIPFYAIPEPKIYQSNPHSRASRNAYASWAGFREFI